MKTAISIPDPVFEAAEAAAKRLSMSRSELYARAVEAFLAAHAGTGVTERLDHIYSETPSVLDPALAKMQSLSLTEEAW